MAKRSFSSCFRTAEHLLQAATLRLCWNQFVTDGDWGAVPGGAAGRAHHVPAAGKESMQHASGLDVVLLGKNLFPRAGNPFLTCRGLHPSVVRVQVSRQLSPETLCSLSRVFRHFGSAEAAKALLMLGRSPLQHLSA